jgi:hypothetical protein
MSLATLARSSLAQFMVIYSEVIAENGDKMTKEQLESLMWEKIIGGVKPSGVSKIPSTMLKKIKAQLPYLPDIINYMGCPALKPCGGLYVPCGGKQADDEQFCATCSKHSAKFGTLADRGAPGTYTDPNDKHEISYGTWLAKNEITIEEVYEELTSAGFTFEIPEDQLAVNAKRAEPKRRPGRPGYRHRHLHLGLSHRRLPHRSRYDLPQHRQLGQPLRGLRRLRRLRRHCHAHLCRHHRQLPRRCHRGYQM